MADQDRAMPAMADQDRAMPAMADQDRAMPAMADQDRAMPAMADQDRAMRLVHLLRTVTVELDLRGAEFARVSGLHATDLRALIHLLDAGRSGLAATPGWLGKRLGMNSAATTAVIDRLERAGHLRRERESPDRRRVHLVVSDQAMTLGWSFFGPLIDGMLVAMRSFTGLELDAVARFLLAMADVAASTGTGAEAGQAPNGRTDRC